MATMQDVARRAGVSLSTVSFALNGTRPVAPATRRRIESAMTELGFRRNALARGLASRRSRIVALLLPAAPRGMNSTAMEFVASAAEAARAKGYHLVLWPLGHEQSGTVGDLCRTGLADGLVLMDVHVQDARLRVIADAGLPVVLIGRSADESVPHVDIDFEATARMAIDQLGSLGHRHLGLVNHSQAAFDAGYGPTVRIDAGLATEAERAGLSCERRFAKESAESGRLAVHTLLDEHPEITALVVMNDDAVFGVLQALRERHLSVPEDFSVLSIVSSEGSSSQTFPRLTALLAPGAELGRLGVESLIDRLEDPERPSPSVLLPCRPAAGGTTAPAPGHTSYPQRDHAPNKKE